MPDQPQWGDYAKPGPYTTSLPPVDEQRFQSWVKQNKIPWQDSPTSDYDMRGFWQAQQAGDPNAKRATNLHFPDTWKTPYHKTFSNESQYALPTAGHWEGQKFVAPQADRPNYDLTSAVKDPDFLSATVADKIAFLSAHDPEFSKAVPKEQGAYLSHIMGFDNMTEDEKRGAMPQNEREANEFLLGAASGASGLPETQTPIKSMIQGLGQKPSTGDVVGQSLLGPGYGIAKGLYQTGKQILAPSGTGEDAALERAHGVGSAVGMAAPMMIGEGVSRTPAPGEMRGAIGDALRTPEGTLKPGVELGAKLAGGAAGTAAGGAVGHPYAGGVLGYKAGPFLLDKAFPESAETVAARKDFLQAKTITEAHEAAIAKNAIIDARAARAKAIADKQKALQAKIPEYVAPGHKEVPLGAPEYPGPNMAIPPRLTAAQQEFLRQGPAKLSDLATQVPSKGGSKLYGPESPAPPINKTYVSYPGDMLVELAKKGDLNAVRELIRNPRGINISNIPGVRYLIEQGRTGRVYGGPTE